MDLSTNYLGFHLPNPFIAGAGPLAETIGSAKRLEDAGAAAIVMRSVFEEQLDTKAAMARISAMKPEEYVMSPDKYLVQLHKIKTAVGIPVAVKLLPFYASLANFAQALEAAGANGMVLFNRFFEADIDVERLEMVPQRRLSDSRELLLRLRWLAILSDSLHVAKLAVTGGVRSAVDAIKTAMCGANYIRLLQTWQWA